MREKKKFAERTKILSSREVRKKYFLVYEGEETEDIYFDAVDKLREEIRINPLIELVPIVRSYSEKGWSNPKKIVERVILNVQEVKMGEISYETLLNRIMEYFEEEGYIVNNRPLAKSMWGTLQWICQEKLRVKLDENVEDVTKSCKRILEILEEERGLENLIQNVTEIVNFANITFAEGFDKICFIVDRDRKSFTERQYDYVVTECQKRKFGLYLTNPCFEFWLLLHFEDVQKLDEEQLLENQSVTSKRKYTEQELRMRMPNYKKSGYDAEMLVRKVDLAIQNEKKFCEEIEQLKEDVGSNVGLLLCEMREENEKDSLNAKDI